jgi:FkbM family methyltransferase
MVSPRLEAARKAYRRGGVAELTKVGRRFAARRVWPGELPEPPKPEPPRPEAPVSSVDYDVAYGWFEKRRSNYVGLSEAVAPYLDLKGVIFDVGANIGYFSKILGETTGFTGTAHLFEPLPHLACLCRKTAEQLPFVTHVHEFGLGDSNALLELWLDTTFGNLGWNTLESAAASKGMVPAQIRVHRFDECGITVEPSFVKIDVEGAEYRVLEGMLPSIEKWATKPPFLVEVGWGQKHPEWVRDLAALNRLRDIGYRTAAVDGTALELADLVKTTDVLFLPE